MQFKPGALVHVRDRDWVVLPSADDDLVLLKPLDGSDEDITGIYRPLDFEEDFLESAEFPYPHIQDLGDFASASDIIACPLFYFYIGSQGTRDGNRYSKILTDAPSIRQN